MRKAGKIPHIHLPHVSQSGFNAKVNVLTFGKLQDNFFCLFSTFSILYNDYNLRPKKEERKKEKRGEGEVRTCFISVQRAKNWFP